VKCLISDRWAKLNLIREIVATHWNGRHRERWTYRFVNDVLLRDSADVLSVNWCEIIIVREDMQAQVYHNTFITDHRLTDQSVAPIVASSPLEDRKREPQHPAAPPQPLCSQFLRAPTLPSRCLAMIGRHCGLRLTTPLPPFTALQYTWSEISKQSP
jgi:hypothetical protein